MELIREYLKKQVDPLLEEYLQQVSSFSNQIPLKLKYNLKKQQQDAKELEEAIWVSIIESMTSDTPNRNRRVYSIDAFHDAVEFHNGSRIELASFTERGEVSRGALSRIFFDAQDF